jgi:hypothetical protein
MFDDSEETGFVLKAFITGAGIVLAGMFTRDHTKNWTDKLGAGKK